MEKLQMGPNNVGPSSIPYILIITQALKFYYQSASGVKSPSPRT